MGWVQNVLASCRKLCAFLWVEVIPHFPFVLLLTLITVSLHQTHLLDVTDSFFMRWAVQDYLFQDASKDGAGKRESAADRIQIIEASPAMRIAELEAEVASASVVERVGGVRPLDRDK